MKTPITRSSTATLTSLAGCMALAMTGFVMVLVLFARRFEDFGDGVEALAFSASAYALTTAFASPFIGRLADRFGRRPIILISLAGYVLVFSGYLSAASTLPLILLRALAGIFSAGLIPAMMSSVGDLAVENQRARWVGILNGSASVGWVIGPYFGGLLYDMYGYFLPFAVSVLLAAGALILAVFLIPESRARHAGLPHRAIIRSRTMLSVLFRPVMIILLFIAFGTVFAYAFIEPQMMFYVYDNLGWSSAQLGLAMSMFGLTVMAGELGLGQLSDRLGRKPVLMVGLVLFSAQFMGLILFREFAWITLSFTLAGLGNALYDTALCAWILDVSPTGHAASLMGMRTTAASLGSLLGPVLVVLLAPLTSPQVVFLIAAILVALLVLVAVLTLHPPVSVEKTSPFFNAAVE